MDKQGGDNVMYTLYIFDRNVCLHFTEELESFKRPKSAKIELLVGGSDMGRLILVILYRRSRCFFWVFTS